MLNDKQKDYQRDYYLRNREKRLAESIAYQREHSEEKKAYLREYYRKNKHKWKPRTREQQERYNAERRLRYATDEAVRNEAKRQTMEWQKRNPEKRLAQRLRKFKITVPVYRRMLEEQGGGCAICGSTNSNDRRRERLHVDHCHKTEVVRGLLCSSCNLGLGKFFDRPELLEKAAQYVRKHSPGNP